jgi:hypothetical protein
VKQAPESERQSTLEKQLVSTRAMLRSLMTKKSFPGQASGREVQSQAASQTSKRSKDKRRTSEI